jgi:DNA primase
MMNRYEAIDIEDYLVAEGLDYKMGSGRSGAQLNVRECPSCGNSNYKVYLHAESGFGNCFVCQQTFNPWTFAKARLGTEDKAAIHRHLDAIRKSLGYRPRRRTKLTVQVDIPEAILPLSMPLPTPDGRNATYLEERGVSGHYAGLFHLRACEYGYHEYKKPGGDVWRQVFNDRIILPVFDLDGQLVTFQGRDVTGAADQKYLFPAGLPGTGRYLYNGHTAMALRPREVIVGEGIFDVIAIQMAIDQFHEMSHIVPVGTFGKHLSKSADATACQFSAFARLRREAGLKTVTFMWDGESEALHAALDAAELLARIGLACRIALLPKEKDPNEVDAVVVRNAWKDATPYSKLLHSRWLVRNPYE